MEGDGVQGDEGQAGPGRGARLVQAMLASRCKRSELAHICNTSERQITRYRAGHPIPKHRLKTICERCEISEQFLLYGEPPATPMTEGCTQPGEGDALPSINREPVHSLHIGLLRYLRCCSVEQQAAMLDRIINNRWAGPREAFEEGALLLNGVSLDRFEIAAVLALRAIDDVAQEVALINQLMSTRPA